MSTSIKYVASFTEEAIDTALRCTLTDDERGTFEVALQSVADCLVKSAKAKKAEKGAVVKSAKVSSSEMLYHKFARN